MKTLHPLAVAVALWLAFAVFVEKSHAFNPATHAQITKSALRFAASHSSSPAVQRWTNGLGLDLGVLEELLIRAAVDADYRPENYLATWFHAPFNGARAGANTSVFSSIFHFINVTAKGKFWDYDGYSFHKSTEQGFDGYLGLPGVVVRGDLSPPLGGKNPGHPSHGIELGPYEAGFKGSAKDWNRLFGGGGATEAVFPPSDVPAQMAFDALLRSPRASATLSEGWTDALTLATGIFDNKNASRHYWRGEIAGLPRGIELLGLAFHMAQDASVPQHAEGTADNCHQDLEDLADSMICRGNQVPDAASYATGQFTGQVECQELYDPSLVESLEHDVPELRPGSAYTVRQRLQAVAMISARWKWGDPDDSIDFMGTELPDGTELTADRCSELMKEKLVRQWVKYQYNLAVAATATLFTSAADAYEGGKPPVAFNAMNEFLKL